MRGLFVFMAALFFAGLAVAQEAAGGAQLQPAAGGGLLAQATPIVLAIIGALFGWLRLRQQKSEDDSKKSEAEKEAERQAMAMLEKSVAATYLSYVRPQRKANGGKFDHKVARTRAMETAKANALPAAKAIYELWGDDIVEGVVHRIANRQGADKPSKKVAGDVDKPATNADA